MSKILTAVLIVMHLFWTLDKAAFVDFCTSSNRKRERKKMHEEENREPKARCNFTVVTAILDHYCSNSQEISPSFQSITQGCPSFSRTE